MSLIAIQIVAQQATRVTRQRVAEYTLNLRRSNSTKTTSSRLDELHYMCRALDPGHDLSWLLRMIGMVKSRNVPVRLKTPRMVGSADLFQLGLRLMEEASAAPVPLRHLQRYRNGLIIALLAACPLRLRNLSMLQIGKHIYYRDVWWVDIPGEDTKTGVPLLLPLPAELTAPINQYLACYRPALAQRWCGRYRPPGDALWISTEGSAMSYASFYMPIMRATRKAFGEPVNPHLFRDCVATSVAVSDPDHVRIVAALLGHRSHTTAERHYNQARNYEAARRWQARILDLRNQTGNPDNPESRQE